MPINLKWIMQRAGLKQALLCEAVKQFNGAPMSVTAIDRLINWHRFPIKTPAHSVKTQIEAWLCDKGIPEDEIAICWDVDDQDRGRDQHPAGVHEQSNTRAQRAAAEAETIQPLEPEMLSEAARKQFSLFRDPFHNDVNDERDVFLTPDIRYVRQAVHMTAKHGGVVAVIADSGAGKTVVRRDFFDRIAREKMPIRVIMPRTFDKGEITASAICEAIIRELAPGARLRRTIEGRAHQAEELLAESLMAGLAHVLVIEEAHKLTDQTFTLLKQFFELEKGFKKLLSIVLFGQSELDTRLDARSNPKIREFINRCEIVRLQTLDRHLEDYVAFKFKRVEGRAEVVLGKDAYDAIRARLSFKQRNGEVHDQVTPLLVNNLITKAMNFCAVHGIPSVDSAVISKL